MTITIGLALILSGLTVTILAFKVGFPRAFAGLGAMGIAGLAGLAQIIFRKKPSEIEFDERDRIIHKRAAGFAFGISYLIVGLACMVPFFVLGPHAKIPVSCLPLIFGAAGITMFFVQSITLLVQYGKGGKDHE